LKPDCSFKKNQERGDKQEHLILKKQSGEGPLKRLSVTIKRRGNKVPGGRGFGPDTTSRGGVDRGARGNNFPKRRGATASGATNREKVTAKKLRRPPG